MKRLEWIDTMKAVGIVLVVMGHTTGLPQPVKNQIYSFHMPLFFWLSGFLLSSNRLDKPFSAYLADVSRSLLIPYLLFATVSLAYWAVSHKYGTLAHTTALQAVSGIAIGHGPALFINTPLWFFTALFLVMLSYKVLSMVVPERAILAFSIILSVAGVELTRDDARLPWNADLAAIALFFYALGREVASWRRGLVFPSIWLFPLAALIWIVLTQLNGEVNMNRALFGHHWFHANAVMGIYLLAWIGHLVRHALIVQWLAHNSLIIFPSHAIFFGGFTALGVLIFKLPSSFKDDGLYVLPYTFAAILCAVPLSWILPKLMPKVFKKMPTSSEHVLAKEAEAPLTSR